MLGDAWYVSNVYIIFDCSMLLYYLFWMLLGLFLHFYYIFGTNLLTGGPVPVAIFCLFQCFAEKEYQTECKRNETFGRVIFGKTWSGGLGVDVKKEARRPRGREARPHPRGPLAAPPTYFFLLYIYPYTPKTSRSTTKPYFHRCNLLYPRDPILGPFPELRRRGHRSRRASTSTP